MVTDCDPLGRVLGTHDIWGGVLLIVFSRHNPNSRVMTDAFYLLPNAFTIKIERWMKELVIKMGSGDCSRETEHRWAVLMGRCGCRKGPHGQRDPRSHKWTGCDRVCERVCVFTKECNTPARVLKGIKQSWWAGLGGSHL